MRFGRQRGATASGLRAAYARAWDAGDAAAAERLVRQLLDVAPDTHWAWFDAGLLAKRRRDWARAAEDNRRALALAETTLEEPAAWNLGIAATALGDWAEAARAWAAYGIDVAGLAVSYDPLVLRLGLTPVRLNPPPRHPGETLLLADGVERPAEVVWCRRLCPARAVIENVPMAASGHRYGDVVLYDGEPVGERVSDGLRYDVFNELAVLERSALPMLEVVVTGDDSDRHDLAVRFSDAGLGAEDHGTLSWMCQACSEGAPSGHSHRTGDEREFVFALAADEERAVEILRAWQAAGAGRSYTEPQRVL